MKSHLLNTWQSTKHREAYLKLGQPLTTMRTKGAYVWDQDGKRYIDFLMGWGTSLFGYQDEQIVTVIKEHLDQKDALNNHSEIEFKLAEKIAKWYPSAMQVGYFLNGSDAATMSVRIARASTGRSKVISCGYHGWHDWAQPTSPGVLAVEKNYSTNFKYKKFKDLCEVFKKEKEGVAALVLETPFPPELFREVKELCKAAKKYNIFIIFDEVKAGGRLGFTPGYDSIKIIPDIAIYGKAFGGGLPLSIITVKEDRTKDIPDEIQNSATFWGHPLALHVASSIIDRISSGKEIFKLKEKSYNFFSSSNAHFKSTDIPVNFYGNPVMPFLDIKEDIRDQFYTRCFEAGLYIRPKHCLFLSTAHTENILNEAIDKLKSITKKLV